MTATKKRRTVADRIRRLGACDDAMKWAAQYPDTPAGRLKGWRECQRPDWMIWILGKTDDSPANSPSRRGYVAVACRCARLCLPNFEAAFPTDKRPREAIELCERYAAGQAVSFEDLRSAAASAGGAADSEWSAAASAVRAAASAGGAAASAVRAADSAWSAAASAVSAADSEWSAAASAVSAAASAVSAAASAGRAVDQQACDIIREQFPKPPEIQEVAR